MRKREAYNEQQVLAWHTAALQRAKRLPRLKSLLVEVTPPARVHRRQTWQEQLAIMDQLAARMEARFRMSPMKRTSRARSGDT